MQIQPNNPLARFKTANFYNPWDAIAKKVGISKFNLIKISKKNKDEVLKMSLGTYLAIKEKLGVEMLDFDTVLERKQND